MTEKNTEPKKDGSAIIGTPVTSEDLKEQGIKNYGESIEGDTKKAEVKEAAPVEEAAEEEAAPVEEAAEEEAAPVEEAAEEEAAEEEVAEVADEPLEHDNC